MPGPFRATGSEPTDEGWIVRFEGTHATDGWQQLYPFNKHTGNRKDFETWAEDVGVAKYSVEPNHILFTDESDCVLALVAWR